MFVVPGSLSGNLGHDRNTRDKTAHLEEDGEIGNTVAEGEGEDEVEDEIEDEVELDIATVGGPVVSDVASG